ncbi:hypothetical protein NX868_26495 [Burkholderia thailandensis]|nr:hypothetical protein [Burkholderia thailandensis]MCS3394739.1 hypothetical protein [Burkholderia thailandensis]MCS6456310.1 hypothetical protein [Burkholderia thailandensis]MCS6485809.1 hypothetical protein [Burkholderia thailandensis]MCS6489409.1 hypothetical protein [Burkholderia thailandensis]MCZ2900113.1 hypothetical protein [Burkholderia thailandensis]
MNASATRRTHAKAGSAATIAASGIKSATGACSDRKATAANNRATGRQMERDARGAHRDNRIEAAGASAGRESAKLGEAASAAPGARAGGEDGPSARSRTRPRRGGERPEPARRR